MASLTTERQADTKLMLIMGGSGLNVKERSSKDGNEMLEGIVWC